MNKYVSLTKKAIETYILTGKKISSPKNFDSQKAGVFVSIHRKSGDLRGCIGTILPTKENIGEEIIHNAIAAATRDNRFPKITKDELPDLKMNVDILSKPEPINGTSALDPKKYGVIVKTDDGRCGILLPDLPDVDSPEIQVGIACQKASINPAEEKYFLYRFEVERYQ
jgi:AmmeMemoRadiSam system protein A